MKYDNEMGWGTSKRQEVYYSRAGKRIKRIHWCDIPDEEPLKPRIQDQVRVRLASNV